MIIVGLTTYGASSFYDYPLYLSNQILKQMFHYDQSINKEDSEIATVAQLKYGSLYSIYYFPNFIIPLFGGLLIDKIGVRFSLILTSGIVTLGSILCTFSGILTGKSDYSSDYSYYVMLMGRFVFALAYETFGNA